MSNDSYKKWHKPKKNNFNASGKLKKGQTLFMQDDPGDALYAVERGSIEISIIGANGKKLSLNIMQPPDVFGEIGALDGPPLESRSMSVSCSF